MAELVMGSVISCRVLTKGPGSSLRAEIFLPQPVITELNSLKFSRGLGRQTGVWTLGRKEVESDNDSEENNLT